MMIRDEDERLMRLALDEAARAAACGEVPVAAVLQVGEALFCAHNRSIMNHDPSAHAEILALRAAGSALGNYRFPNATLYVTLEPCLMCLGALLNARIKRLVFAAYDKRFGACGSCLDLAQHPALNHRIEALQGGLLEAEAVALLQQFFRARR